jgi:hypothetical protein
MLAHKGRQEMENPKSNFDWVNARAQCSLLVVFKQLEWGCQEDVKSANAKRKEGGHFKFEVASFPSRFCVLIDGDFSEKREVNFSLEKNGIKITSGDSLDLFATITLNNDGECRLKLKDEEMEFWQVRRATLEGLFFGPLSR